MDSVCDLLASRARGSGATFQPAVMPPSYVPESQTIQGPDPKPAPAVPKVLSMWPLRTDAVPGFFDPGDDAILPEFRFGEQQLGALHLIGREIAAWEAGSVPTINQALNSNDANVVASWRHYVRAEVDKVFNMLTPAVQGMLLAANDGLTAASKAFNEIVAELRAWPANAVPAEIINAVTRYSEAWSLVTEKAAGRFKAAAVVWMDLQARVLAMIGLERQLAARESGLLQTQLADAEARNAELQEKITQLQKGGGLLESIRSNFEGLLSQGKEAVSKALTAVGAALPSFLTGAGGMLALLAAAAAALFIFKR